MKDINCLISIIVPVYNVEEYLKKCLNSIIKQTYKNIEIILVDDGSTDNSNIIYNKYKEKDSRIKVLKKVNGGLSSARNEGLKISKGEYITFIDSDDYIEEDYIEYLYNLIKDNNALISSVKYNSIYNNNIKIEEKEEKIEVISKNETYVKLLYDEIDYSVCTKMFSKKLFEYIEFPLGKSFEDVFTLYKLIDKVDKVVISNQKKYNYYIRNSSITTSSFNKKHLDLIEAVDEMTSFLEKKYNIDKQAINRKKTQSRISTLCRMINSKNRNKIEEKKIYKYIMKNYNILIKNKNTPKRDKYALFLLKLGIKPFKLIWNIYNKKR